MQNINENHARMAEPSAITDEVYKEDESSLSFGHYSRFVIVAVAFAFGALYFLK